MTDDDRITVEVGPLSDAEIASLFGRNSATRARVNARGANLFPYALPPVEKDASLRSAAEGVIRVGVGIKA